MAERLRCDEGFWTLEFTLDHGDLRRTHLKRGPFANDELEDVAVRSLLP